MKGKRLYIKIKKKVNKIEKSMEKIGIGSIDEMRIDNVGKIMRYIGIGLIKSEGNDIENEIEMREEKEEIEGLRNGKEYVEDKKSNEVRDW